MARSRGKRSLVGRMLHHMKPNHIGARFISGGRHQTFTAIAKSPFKARTVHTPKTGRRAYDQRMATERKTRAAAAARARKQALADKKAARAQQRRRQRRAPRATRQPVAVNPRTGKAITWREAQAGIRAAERELKRIEAELAGRKPVRKRAAKATPAPKTPLQRAVEDVRKARKSPSAETTPAKKAAPKTTKPKSRKPRVQPHAPVPAGTAPAPLQRPGRNLTGVAMAASCECHGTGRIPVYRNLALAGTVSCPKHGRRARGDRKHFTRTAARDAGLPGLKGFLAKKRGKQAKRLDRHQSRVSHRAMHDLRHMGPTGPCPQTAHCTNGVWDRKARDVEREVWTAEYVAARTAAGERVPSRRRLRALASRALPYDHCHTCGGLGRVRTSTQVTADGGLPVWEWRAAADLKKGHRLTGREKATGKRPTENAAWVERRRKLPRL